MPRPRLPRHPRFIRCTSPVAARCPRRRTVRRCSREFTRIFAHHPAHLRLFAPHATHVRLFAPRRFGCGMLAAPGTGTRKSTTGRVTGGAFVLPLPGAIAAPARRVRLSRRLSRCGDRLPVPGCEQESYWTRDHLLRFRFDIGRGHRGFRPASPPASPSGSTGGPTTLGDEYITLHRSAQVRVEPALTRRSRPPAPVSSQGSPSDRGRP